MISAEQVIAESLLENKSHKTEVGIYNYGNYSSKNYGAHTLRLDVGPLSFYFSYTTVVAFSDEDGTYISENKFGPTTGKHLNWIDDNKNIRMPREEFDKKLSQTLLMHGLAIG